MEPRRKTALASPESPAEAAPNDLRVDDGIGELRKYHSATLLSRTVGWIESKKVPACIARRWRNSAGEDIFIVTGLRKVFYGTQPAADVVKVVGIHPPRYLCFMISGSGCDIIQFVVYVLVYPQLDDATLSWAVSFGSSIVFRHTSHRYLVFGDYVGGYWRSLGRMYAGYSVIIVLSTIFTFLVTKCADLSHNFVFILTLSWTGIVNYFILKKLWSFGGRKKENHVTTEV